jgi:phosphatidylglycerol:prolipoprotein diacylglycerol transferase
VLPFPNISPVAFSFGPIQVRWYALAYLGGVALGGIYGTSLLRRRSLWPSDAPPFAPAVLLDFAFWAVIGIVLGGRIGYVLFYNLPLYVAHPLEAFAVWDGGMSFHGGLIGLAIAMILFARKHGARALSGLDLLAAVAPIGLLLGRIANFINGELYGAVTTLPWGIVFPDAGDLPRHPSELYEAGLEGLLLLGLIFVAARFFGALRRPGLAAGIFGVGYAISRMLVELVRVPDAQLGYLAGGWLTMGQLLSMPVLLAGIGLIIWSIIQPRSTNTSPLTP